MDKGTSLPNTVVWAIVTLAAILLMRLWLLNHLPLYDTTEARYAEIARIMFETKNWITPQIDYHVPFWGKPPMHTWMSAFSFNILGVSGFTARLPHYLCGLFIMVLIYLFAKKVKGDEVALVATLVLASSLGFIVASGMVMTDIALLFAVTLSMIAFWNCFTNGEKFFYGHLFFVGLGFGMLVKGPVAVVLVAIGISMWMLVSKNYKKAFTSLPWLTGGPLFLFITLPWYLLAERETPGFLQYFFVGEHFHRFIVSGWEGDLYGNAHDRARGTIWVYWLLASFPWTFLLLFAIAKTLRHSAPTQPKNNQQNHCLSSFLICWMIAPMVLFTFAGNVLLAYVLPGFGAMSVLVAMHFQLSKKLIAVAASTFLLLLVLPMLKQLDLMNENSDIHLLGKDTQRYNQYPLYYWSKRHYSARFYSNGQAQLIQDNEQLSRAVTSTDGAFIATKIEDSAQFFPRFLDYCNEHRRNGERLLLFCKGR